MSRLTYKEYISIAILFTIIGIFTLLTQRPWQVGASVTVGNGYQSTTTPTVADERNLCPAQGFAAGTASSSTGVLGSIVVTGPSQGELIIYDATTTDNTKRVPVATSSLILAQIPKIAGNTGTSTGTFTFDSVFTRGLLVDHTGANTPTTTITWRCNE